jgi:hypothetical protein
MKLRSKMISVRRRKCRAAPARFTRLCISPWGRLGLMTRVPLVQWKAQKWVVTV